MPGTPLNDFRRKQLRPERWTQNSCPVRHFLLVSCALVLFFNGLLAQADEALPSSEQADTSEVSPTPSSSPLPEESTQELPEPEGEGMGKAPPFATKGYLRAEFAWHQRNAWRAYDEGLTRWTPRGAPLLLLGLVADGAEDAWLEANLEGDWTPGDRLSGYVDCSAVYAATHWSPSVLEQASDALVSVGSLPPDYTLGAEPVGVPMSGTDGRLPPHPAAFRLQTNEAYLRADLGSFFTLTLGKRRLSFSSAFTFVPLDIMNPAFNPLEPTLQREGSWNIALSLVHFDALTATLVYRPRVWENAYGLPAEVHWTEALLAARLFWNVFESDVNIVFFSDRGRPLAGFSFSRYFGLLEVHAEGLTEPGSTQWTVSPALDPSQGEAPYEIEQVDQADCGPLGSCPWRLEAVAGVRYAWNSGANLLLEARYKGGGLSHETFGALLDYTEYLETDLVEDLTQVLDMGEELDDATLGTWEAMVSRTPLLYQETDVRRHYFGLSYIHSELKGRYKPRLSVIGSLDELSVVLFPSVTMRLGRRERASDVQIGVLHVMGDAKTQSMLYPSRTTVSVRWTQRF